MSIIKKVISKLRQDGPKRFLVDSYNRVLESYHERRLNVETQVMVNRKELGLDADCLDYVAIGYPQLFQALDNLPKDKSNSVFLDYGSGKGRALAAAATYPFKKVIGVELNENLVTISKKNMEMLKHRQARSIEVIHADARKFTVPPDVNVIYFFNPFLTTILEQVWVNIQQSYQDNPRLLHIIAINNVVAFDKISKGHNWLTKVVERKIYPSYSCALYKTTA